MTSYPTYPASRSGLAASLVASVLGRQPVVAVPTAFIQLLPDCTAATFLAQCCHLSERSADPDGWFERSHPEWRADLCLSPEQVRRCVRDCGGMVEVQRRGLPARNFYRVLPEGVRARLATLVPTEEVEQPKKTQKGLDDVGALPAPLPGDSPLPSGGRGYLPDVEVSGQQAGRQTPQHSSSSFRKEKKEEKKPLPQRVKDNVQPSPPVRTESMTKLLAIWNANRGELPEAVGLSTHRRKALTVLLSACGGDEQKAAQLLSEAVKEVAADDFWKAKKFGVDTLLPRVLGKAETYRSRQGSKGIKLPEALPEFGVGQLVMYRREKYAIEAVTERHIDLWDDENGGLRVYFGSDDIRSVRPLEVRA